MTSRRAADLAAAVLLALAAAALLTGLARLPALTGDEAWIGLYALRLRAGGFFTPHEMNTYTGPLYGLALSRVLAWRGVSVGALRGLGAALNALALLLAFAHLRRRLGAEAGAWFAALATGSAYFLLKSRLAWDVYALQPLLLALTLPLLDGPATFPRALAFAALTLVGVQNHFIYLSVPVSLCILYGARAAWRGEDAARPSLRLSVAALAASAVVFLVKPRLTEAAWPAERVWAVPLFLALPVLAAAAASVGAWEGPLVELLRRPAVRRWAGRVLALGLLAFAIWHGVPFWQALSGPLLWRRIFSWTAPWWLALPLRAWGAFLVAVLAWRAVRAWHDERLDAAERTLALWPAAYAALFIAFRNTSSLRYYSLAQFLSLLSLAAALPRLPRPDRRWALGFAALAVAAAQGVFWRELAAPGDRRPQSFKIGWHMESSWDFARKDAMFAAFDASGACDPYPEHEFVQVPLAFHRAEVPAPGCDQRRSFRADYCRDCAAPPFQRWEVVSAPR